jgi:hypothetical protein
MIQQREAHPAARRLGMLAAITARLQGSAVNR